MPIYDHITDLIGRTPLLRLTNYSQTHSIPATLLAKPAAPRTVWPSA